MANLLSEQKKMMIAVAAFEAKGDLVGLKTAINEALDGEITINEVKEILSQLYAYTGFPRSLNGLSVLQMVLEKRRTKNIKDKEGKEASHLKSGYDALMKGTRVQTKLLGGKPFSYSFAPEIDYYLKAHLFGDIFARDILTYADREIITLSALASIEGTEPQLKAHITGAKNMGVSDEELHEIPTILAAKVGKMEAYRTKKAIAEVYGEKFCEDKSVESIIFPIGKPNTAYAKYFIGKSYLAPLLKEGLPMSNVTFEPSCRNNWHIHHKSIQILICVGGEGWYQEWGKPAQKLYAGNVVSIPVEVKHWHGATSDSWFQHIAIAVSDEGASNEWLEPVTDEKYNKLK